MFFPSSQGDKNGSEPEDTGKPRRLYWSCRLWVYKFTDYIAGTKEWNPFTTVCTTEKAGDRKLIFVVVYCAVNV